MGVSTFEGRVLSNIVGNGGSAPVDGYGLRLAQEDNSRMTMEVTGNTIQNTYLSGLEAVSRLATTSGTLNLTMRNNTIETPVTDYFGAHITAGGSGSANNTLCLDIGYNGTSGGNVISGKNGIEGIDLVQKPGSTFQVEGWNTGAQPSVAQHVQAFNSSTATSAGTFSAVAAGACPMPASADLPPAVALLDNPDLSMASESPSMRSNLSVVPYATPGQSNQNLAAIAETVNVNIGILPAGDSVIISFDVQILATLPENVLKISNQAAATSSSFAGEVLSDDPATIDQSDATETILYRPPGAHGDAYSTLEDTLLTVPAAGVLSNDITAIGYEGLTTAIKESNPASGTLTFNPDGSFTYTPESNFYGKVNFNYHAYDTHSGSNSVTVEINVTPVNDAPLLDTGGSFSLQPIAQIAVNNPGTLVTALIASPGGDPIQDVDDGALEGIAVTSVDNTHGVWQYTINGGTSWHDFDAPSASAARLLAADTAARVRFVPDQSWNGVIDPGVRFHAWDRTSGVNGETQDVHSAGGQSAFSLQEASARIVIHGSNDLSVAMDAPAGPVMAGGSLDYTIHVANAGPAEATNVVVRDDLPAGVSFVSASPQCTAANQTVTCTIDSLGVGDNAVFTISVKIGVDTRGILTNTAEVTADEADLDGTNNTSQVSREVDAEILVYSSGDHPGDEWNKPLVTTSPNGTTLLGEFGSETIRLSLTDLPGHVQAIVTFDLYIIRSWDGNQETWPGDITFSPYLPANTGIGPDHWKLQADQQTLLDTTFANWSVLGFHQAYPKNYPEGSYPAQTGAAELSGLGYGSNPPESTYHMSYTIDHQNPNLTLDFSASGLQDISDESWGLGNVKVVLTAGAVLLPHKLYCPITLR